VPDARPTDLAAIRDAKGGAATQQPVRARAPASIARSASASAPSQAGAQGPLIEALSRPCAASRKHIGALYMFHPTWSSTLTTSLTNWGETSGTLR
jgi:hypothetical protein